MQTKRKASVPRLHLAIAHGFFLTVAVLLISCHGDMADSVSSHDLEVQVVRDDGSPLEQAEIVVEGQRQLTDGDGRVRLKSPTSETTIVQVRADGYAPTAVVAEGSTLRATLLPLGTPIEFNADVDAEVVVANQLKLTIPVGSLVDARGNVVKGIAYTTVVRVDPLTKQRAFAPVPRTLGPEPMEEGYLESLFLAEMSFWKDGQRVQVASDRTVRIEMVLPKPFQEAFVGGEQVGGYWFDFETNLWKQEGSGTIQASTIVPEEKAWIAELGHFTWWSPGTASPTEKQCVNVTTQYNGSPVGGIRIQVDGLDYQHVGGLAITNAGLPAADKGKACVEFQKGKSVRLIASHPAGYTIVNIPDNEIYDNPPIGSGTCTNGLNKHSLTCDYTVFLDLSLCGNGVVNPGEPCDDGNTSNNDACTNQCIPAACGDGFQQPGEPCDDGNASNTDGCLVGCVAATCGDGFVRAGVEQCDDGNMAGTDNCTSLCQNAVCGDGFLHIGFEQCDDGNSNQNDGCHNNCLLPACGDGIFDPGEACDDGNVVAGDGCSPTCAVEGCGNMVVDPGEQCDDGNANNNDGCTILCKFPYCGDGFVNGAEACDLGLGNSNTGACTLGCQNAICGDGLVWAGNEQCDDGNAINTDGCLNSCVNASCGDNVVWAGNETCDDGNSIPDDGCTNCQLPGAAAWTQTYNGASNSTDRGYAIASDAAGNVLVAGAEFVVGQGQNIWVRKVDPAGNVVWTNTFNGPSNLDDYGFGIAASPSGDVVVAGVMTMATSLKDIWVGKLNAADGALLWSQTYNGASSGDDWGYNIASDSAGNVFVGGTVRIGSVDYIWVAKYLPTGGAPSWIQTMPPNVNYTVSGVNLLTDNFGDVVVTASETLVGGGGPNDKVWRLRYSNAGSLLSSKNFDVAGFVIETATTPAGDVLVAGYQQPGGQDDIWYGKYDPLGQLVWQTGFAGAAGQSDRAYGISTDPSGNVLVCGYEFLTGQNINIWVRKVTPNASSVLWTQTYNAPSNTAENALGIAADPSGNVLVTGYESATGQGNNIWVRKYSP